MNRGLVLSIVLLTGLLCFSSINADENEISLPKIDGYAKFRFNYSKPEDRSDYYDIWFNVANGRLGVRGDMFDRLASFRILTEYASGSFKLLDYYVVINVQKALKVKVGQFKVPFTRQYYQSATKHAFIDVALPVKYLKDGRDIGVELFATNLFEGIVEYHVGVFNGNGLNKSSNDNTDFEIAGKVVAKFGTINQNQEGIQPQSRGVAVGVSGYLNYTGVDTTGEERMGIAAEATAGVKGFFLTGEYIQMTRSIGESNVGSSGFYGQAGYILIPKTLEIVGRYSQYDPDTETDNDAVSEIRGGFIVYHAGHNHKLSVEGVQITQQTVTDNVSSLGAAMQYQFCFK